MWWAEKTPSIKYVIPTIHSPAAHTLHDDQPDPDEYLPAAHTLHTLMPPDPAYRPAPHATHDTLPTGKYQPNPQHNACIHTNPSPPDTGSTPFVVPADPTPTPTT